MVKARASRSRRSRAAATASTSQPRGADARSRWLIVLAAFVLAFAVYAPALQAPFFSDDGHYVRSNAYIQTIDVDNLAAIWSPRSAVVGIVENYAPVHLMLHALAWQAFGTNVLGHHALGVALHALASLLLVGLLRSAGVRPPLALGLAAIFLVHPANIEAVAWISQLKTTSAMVLMLGALALRPSRPVAALGLFALALLAKPTAAVALPVAALWRVIELRSDAGVAPTAASLLHDAQLRWLGGWALAFASFALAEFAAFFETAGSAPAVYAEMDVRLRSIVAVAFRYVVMAISGSGLAVFHDPPGSASWLEPWFLGGVVWMGFVAWRVVASARSGSLELVFWCFAVVSFAPVSGVIPLPHPLADRYLYFMLPGLLGALGVFMSRRYAGALPRGVVAMGAVVVAVFAVASFQHARLWHEPSRLLAHSEARYPGGKVATLRAARRAALAGDVEATVALLRRAMARGFDRLDTLVSDPRLSRAAREHGLRRSRR